MSGSVRYVNCSKKCLSLICHDGVQFQMEIRKIGRRLPRSVDDAELGHFTLLGTLSNDDDDATDA